MKSQALLSAAAVVALCCFAEIASATACFTSEDGDYDCNFLETDRDGSFEISAPNKPTYILDIDRPGVAFGYVNFGDGSIALPGLYLRSRSDRACWVNSETGGKICAW
jgi:hypothetical protein